MLLAGTLSFSATAAASESGLLPAAAAQQQPVKGTIVDVNGNPIPGASVMIPGTTTGTVTLVDGTFSLNIAEGTTVEVGCRLHHRQDQRQERDESRPPRGFRIS